MPGQPERNTPYFGLDYFADLWLCCITIQGVNSGLRIAIDLVWQGSFEFGQAKSPSENRISRFLPEIALRLPALLKCHADVQLPNG